MIAAKRLFIFYAPVFCVSLFSCSDDDPKLKNARRYGGEVTYLANGQVVGVTKNSIYVSSGTLNFESFLGSDEQLSFTVYTGIGKTSYDLKKDVVSMLYYSEDRNNNYVYQGDTPAGDVVITEIDEVNKTMSGTFSGNLHNSSDDMIIANGIFTNVPYVIQNEDERKGSLQIAKLDGSDFKGKLYTYGMTTYNYGFGFSSAGKILDFNLPLELEAGVTYDISAFDESQYEGIEFIDGLYSYKATSGAVTITELTAGQHIKGTFSFEAESYPLERTKKTFTEGSFDVTLGTTL